MAEDLRHLLEANQRWAEGSTAGDPDYFERVRAFAKLNLSDAERKDWT